MTTMSHIEDRVASNRMTFLNFWKSPISRSEDLFASSQVISNLSLNGTPDQKDDNCAPYHPEVNRSTYQNEVNGRPNHRDFSGRPYQQRDFFGQPFHCPKYPFGFPDPEKEGKAAANAKRRYHE